VNDKRKTTGDEQHQFIIKAEAGDSNCETVVTEYQMNDDYEVEYATVSDIERQQDERGEGEENEDLEEQGELHILVEAPPTKQRDGSSSKRKSKTLTMREKYEIIRMKEDQSLSVQKICEMYGIGRTTIYDFMRNKNKIIEFMEKCQDGTRRTLKQSKYPTVENQLIDWCHAMDLYSRTQFYEQAKSCFAEAKVSGINSSDFCGSWSWGKRFFDRHPDLKCKLIQTSDGDMGIPLKPLVRSQKNLSKAEKEAILDSLDNGKTVIDVAKHWNVCRETVYDIFRKRNVEAESEATTINYFQKIRRMPKHPELEVELLEWCLMQNKFPISNVVIADQASCLFDQLNLSGVFNPSSQWAKKFVLRHPELAVKQGLETESEFAEQIEEIQYQEHIIEEEEQAETEEFEDEAIHDEDFDYIEQSDGENTDEGQFVVEELDPDYDQSQDEEVFEVPPNDDDPIATTKDEIPDEMALKSLRILIAYSQQRGHDEYLPHLMAFQNELDPMD